MKKIILMIALLRMLDIGGSCLDDIINPLDYEINYIELAEMEE